MDVIAKADQPRDQRGSGLGHAFYIHDDRHGNIEQGRQIGTGGLAVEKPHGAFHQDQVRFAGGVIKALAAVGLACHP